MKKETVSPGKRSAVMLVMVIWCFLFPVFSLRAAADVFETTLATDGVQVTGAVVNGGDVNRYKITLTVPGRLSVSYQGRGIQYSYYKLRDENLETQFYDTFVSNSSEASPKTSTETRYLEKGIYYLDVIGSNSSRTGTYAVKAEFAPTQNTETEPNDTFETAQALSAGTKITGLISATDRLDFYRITVPSSQKITITYQGMINYSYISLWSADREKLHREYVGTGSEASPKTYTHEVSLNAGTYYLKVEPSSASSHDQSGRYTLLWQGQSTTAPETEPEKQPEQPKQPEQTPAAPAGTNTDNGSAAKGTKVVSAQAQYTVTTKGEVSYSKRSAVSGTVTIPDTITVGGVQYKVTSVSSKAFAGNNSITKVVIGKNVKKIGAQAFARCKNLKTVKFGKGLTTIGSKAFYGCTSLKRIDLPKTLTKIGKKAFYGCTKLKKIIIRSKKLKKAKVGSGAFSKISSNAAAYVPSSKTKAYRKVLKGLKKSTPIVSIM